MFQLFGLNAPLSTSQKQAIFVMVIFDICMIILVVCTKIMDANKVMVYGVIMNDDREIVELDSVR